MWMRDWRGVNDCMSDGGDIARVPLCGTHARVRLCVLCVHVHVSLCVDLCGHVCTCR